MSTIASIEIIKCGECLAFVTKNERYGQGECHRRAPVPGERDDVLWPKRLASEPGCWEGIKSAARPVPADPPVEPIPGPKTKEDADKGW